MKSYTVFLILLALAIAWSCTKTENFTEIFGFAGYKTPTSNISINYTSSGVDMSKFQESGDAVTRDDINDCLKAAEKFMKDRTKLCAYPIETNKCTKYTDDSGATLYRCRFMYSVTNTGFPFGFGASVDVLNGAVVAFNTQSSVSSNIKPMEQSTGADFVPIADLSPKPNLST